MRIKHMRYNKSNLLRFGIMGGFFGGLIAIIGFLLLSPETDSVVLFVLLRVAIGVVVAMIVGPLLITKQTEDKQS